MRIGIDLGGTKIEAIVLDDGGREIARKRIDTPKGDYDGTVDAICDLVGMISTEAKAPAAVPVGVGIPGAISPASGLVKNANSTCLIGHPLDRDLQARLRRPVRLANDADCFCISEATDGAGAAHEIVFGVILGTGVGGGLVFNKRLLSGPNAITGEWGHCPLPWPQELDGGQDERPGRDCYCGQQGCIETLLSGPALVHDHETSTGQRLAPQEIVARAENGDPDCEKSLFRYEHRLARGLAMIINILDPGVIVLGGGMSNIDRLYANVPRLWPQWVFSDRCDTQLKMNVHGDSSGVRGAAWL